MIEPIVRDIDVVSGNAKSTSTVTGPAINPHTGEPYSGIWFAKDGGTGDGTIDDPTNVTNAVAQAGEKGIIAVLDTGGVIDVSGLTLQDYQTLIGSGGNLEVSFHDLIGFFSIPGTSTTMTDSGGDDVITLGQNNVISDVTLDEGGRGIFGDEAGNVVIKN